MAAPQEHKIQSVIFYQDSATVVLGPNRTIVLDRVAMKEIRSFVWERAWQAWAASQGKHAGRLDPAD